MTAKETLEILNKQWCSSKDIKIIAETSQKNAQEIKRKIKNNLEKKGYLLPSYLVPTTAVIEYLKIDIEFLESRVACEEKLK